jgi:hypothetical protein
MKPEDFATTGLALVDLGQSVARGEMPNPVEIARTAAAILVRFIPAEDMTKYLTEAAEKRVELAADLAGDAKFGPDR